MEQGGIIRYTKDHPRVGGEKWRNLMNEQKEKGSPPRGRGKVAHPCKCVVALGITPAWAGKRRTHITPITNPWDHPRVGGEKTKKIP